MYATDDDIHYYSFYLQGLRDIPFHIIIPYLLMGDKEKMGSRKKHLGGYDYIFPNFFK